MRLVRVLVPDEHRQDLLDALSDDGIDYVVTAESSRRDDASIVEFPLPTQAVETVMDDLRDAGLDRHYTVVSSAETVNTENFGQLRERFSREQDDSVDRAEIRAKATQMTPNPTTYYTMTFLSAVVAASGLLLDSAAIVVGAMVIAPQVSAALTASIGTVFDDRAMIVDGFRSLLLGLGLAIVGALLFGWLLRAANFVPAMLDVAAVTQIERRISPGVLAVVVGAGAGAAGAFGLATAIPLSIVGVMIAAALIPAAAAVGIGIAWSLPSVALGAFALVVINTVLITLSATAVLWMLGYRPDDWNGDIGLFERIAIDPRRPTVLALVLLLAVLAITGVVVANEVAFENEVNDEIEATLSQERYSALELVEVQVQFTDGGVTDEDRRVSIVVSRPADAAYPELPDRLAERITDRTDTAVSVEIEHVERAWSDRR